MAGPRGRSPSPGGPSGPDPRKPSGPAYRGDVTANRFELGKAPLDEGELKRVRERRSAAELIREVQAAAKSAPQSAGASATYRSADFDYPVTVTGFAGERDGVRYFTIEGSSAAIPESQLVFRSPADMDRILGAQQADPGVEAEAARAEGTAFEERTAPPQRQVWTQEDTLRTIDQVHANSEKILGRMITDSRLSTGNYPKVRKQKFAGKTLQPRNEFESAVAAALDLRREMAKPNPSVAKAWEHTQKLLVFMRGKEWANEIVPDLSVFEPDSSTRSQISNAEATPRRLPSGLIEKGGSPVRTPVLRGPEERRNASAGGQYTAVESARQLFDDKLDALRRTIRGTFQGPEYDLANVSDDVMPPATKAQVLERLNKIVRETLGREGAQIGFGTGAAGESLTSPRAAVEAIENHLRQSTPAENLRTATYPTAPSGEPQTYSSPAIDARDVGGYSYTMPDGRVVEGDEALAIMRALESKEAAADAERFGARLDRMLGQQAEADATPAAEGPKVLRKPGAVSLEEARSAAAAERQRASGTAEQYRGSSFGGTVQRPEVIRQRLAELNAEDPAPDTPLGYETYNSNATTEVNVDGMGTFPEGISRIEDRIAGRTRDQLPEAPQQEINNITRYRVRLQGTPTMPRGGSELQTKNQPMLVQEIAKRDGSGQWEDLSPLRAEVRRYGDTFLIISENGQPFEVRASELESGVSALPKRIDLTRAREIASSGARQDVQTPSDVDRAFKLYNNQRYRKNWWEYFRAMPDERISRQAAEPVRNRGIDVAETNTVSDDAARAAATDLVRQLQANDLDLSRGGDESIAPETLAAVMSYLDRNPEKSLVDLLDGPSGYGRSAELRRQRSEIESRSDISEAEKAELLAGVTQAEFEVQFPGRGATRLEELMRDRSRVRTILGRVLEGNPDAATPMTLSAVDWLRRNAQEVFRGPDSAAAEQAASNIERVVADQYFRPAPDRTGPRTPLGPQASAWRSRMREEMGRLGIKNLAIFGDLENDVNLQLQSSRFDDSAMSAGESAGLAGARAGLEPDRRRAAGPRPSIEDNPELGMIAREEGDSAESNPRAGDDGLSEASPQYRNLLERAQILAMEAGVDHTGTLGSVLARLNSEAEAGSAAMSQRGRPGELKKLNESVQAMLPRDDTSEPGTLASLFGNDQQRQAWAQTLFRGTQEEMEQNMRMLFLTWLNNPLARNAIDRQGKAGVNPFFAAPRQSAEGADLGPVESSNVEWVMSRLDDLEAQRRQMTGGMFQQEMEDSLIDDKPLIQPNRRNNARLQRIESEIAALKEANPGIFETYQQFKDEVGNAFRRELSEMPSPGVGDDRPARRGVMQRAREFFGFGDREEGMNLRQMLAGGKPVSLPGRASNTRVAELKQFLDSIETVAGAGRRGIDPSVSNQEASLLRFLADNPEAQLTDGDLAAIRQVLETGEGELDPSISEKLRRAGAFGEAILRGEQSTVLGPDNALRKNADLLPAQRRVPIAELPERRPIAQSPTGPASGSSSAIPASRLRQIRELQRTLQFALTPDERAPLQRQIDELSRSVNVVDTQATPTATAAERYEAAQLPEGAGSAVEEQLSRLSDILQAVEEARRRAPAPSSEMVSTTVPADIPSASQRRSAARRASEPVGPLGRLEMDEATLEPLADSLVGSGFYAAPYTPGANLLEAIAGERRPVAAGELTDQRSALAAETQKSPEDIARLALQRLAAAEMQGRRLGIDISDMAFDDPDLPQRLDRRAKEFRQMAEESKAEAGGYSDDNSSYLEAVASKFEEAANAVNRGYIDSRSARGIVADSAPGQSVGDQSPTAQPRVSLGGPGGSAFFRGGDGSVYLKANVEGGRPLFVPIQTGGVDAKTGKSFSPNWRVDERGRLQRVGPALREDPNLPQSPRRAIPDGGPQKPPVSDFEYENMQQYFEDTQPAPDLDEPQIDDMGAGIPGMGAPVAMNAAPGDTNTYANDPEAVLRRLRQTVRPAAVMA